MKNRKLSILITLNLIMGLSLGLMGCTETVEEEPLIVVDSNEETISYKTVPAQIIDITSTASVTCKYVQTKEQEVTCPVGGKIIDKVYVKEGDVVKAGDVLVELQVGNVEEEIADLKYKIAREELELGYLDKAEEFEMTNSYYRYVYDSKMEEEDYDDWEERDASIEENYSYQREDKLDALEFDKKKLSKLEADFKNNRIYATISGTVLTMEKNLEGSTAKRGEVIMTVVDNANGIFEAEDTEKASYFKEGVTSPMSVVYGDGKGEYEVTPYNMNSWGDTQQFLIVSQPENATLEVGTSGTIKVTLDSKEKVLGVPSNCIYMADDKYYVYVLDENGMRKVQFVEIGLQGDTYTEIVSGISAGDEVVKK